MKRVIAISLLGAVLVGCSQARTYSDIAATKTKEANDITANILTQAVCQMTLGAWVRMSNAARQQAVLAICVTSPPPAAPLADGGQES